MRKILVFLIVLFISILKVNALNKFYIGEKVLPEQYVGRESNDQFHNGLLFKLMREDGEYVYCVNPFVIGISNLEYEEYNYNDSKFNIPEDSINEMNLISYFGYGYKNHTDIKWYGITQYLIWSKLNLNNLYYTDTYYGNKVDLYVDEINEINSLIDEYYKLPNFNNNFILDKNEVYEMSDLNNVIDNFEILDSNIDAKISNNKLIIKTTEDGIYNIKFIKRSPINREFKLYYKDDSQALFYPGKISDITFDINVEVVSGSITINKIANDTSTESSLENAVYGIYKDDLLVNTLYTDKNGYAKVENLKIGDYYIKEITPSKGYLLDDNIYTVTIDKDNRDFIIKSYENLIYGNLILNKYYGELDNYQKELDAVFEIYDSNTNLVDKLELIDGSINIKLKYGNYLIIQTSGIEGYRFVDNFNVFIKSNEDYIYDLYDELIYGNLVINKYYGESDNYIKEDGAVFAITSESDSYIGITNSGLLSLSLPYGKYSIKQTSGIDGYSYVDEFTVDINGEDIDYDLYDELIVEVPNTGVYKDIRSKYMCMIFTGITLIIYSRKKTTHE